MRAETGDFDPSLVRGGSLTIPAGRRRATGKSGARELAQEKGNPIWGFGWRGGLPVWLVAAVSSSEAGAPVGLQIGGRP
jgi:hypothetical protein